MVIIMISNYQLSEIKVLGAEIANLVCMEDQLQILGHNLVKLLQKEVQLLNYFMKSILEVMMSQIEVGE